MSSKVKTASCSLEIESKTLETGEVATKKSTATDNPLFLANIHTSPTFFAQVVDSYESCGREVVVIDNVATIEDAFCTILTDYPQFSEFVVAQDNCIPLTPGAIALSEFSLETNEGLLLSVPRKYEAKAVADALAKGVDSKTLLVDCCKAPLLVFGERNNLKVNLARANPDKARLDALLKVKHYLIITGDGIPFAEKLNLL